ncbi:MAG TPA: SCO1664 family protein [Acidimicrobiales bacterium]|nr:SCO1664 family protein [Acidimicrobiales bacterium]
MPQDERSPAARRLRVLATGEVEVLGRLPWSSNRTFLTTCCASGDEVQAVYKPKMGERRLWDFPEAVYRREVAAYALSEMLGWGLVPETIERSEAPFGPGSLQRFVDSDFSQHHFTLVEDPAHHERLRAICAFDVVANNADRKSGHCLLGDDGTIWAIDNGLCFHREPKLRTVIWEFAGERLPERVTEDLDRLHGRLPGELSGLLTVGEIEAVSRRARALVADGRFPVPDPDRHHYPWPLV